MPRGARSSIPVTSLTTQLTASDEALIPVWRTPPRRLLRDLWRAAVAEGGEQLGGGAVLGGLEVRVGPQRHVGAGVPGPAGGRAPVHALRDLEGNHEMAQVVQATPQA